MSLPSPYAPGTKHPIPARSGVAVPLHANQTIHIINTHGTQVVDLFAFCSASPTSIAALEWYHHLSMSHTRASTCRLSPLVGDVLVTTRREPMLEVLEDTSGGVHDTLIAACDLWRYRELEGKKRREKGGLQVEVEVEVEEGYYHDSCADNLIHGLIRDLGLDSEDVPDAWATPQPLNLFMNIPVHTKGESESDGGGGSGSGNDDGGRKAPRKEVSPSAGADLSFERPVSKPGTGVKLRALRGCVVVMSACPQDMLEINCGRPVECEFVVEEAK